MLSIKLRRIGKKKEPYFRLIVVDRKKDPWGESLENVGFYNPRAKPKVVDLKTDRIKYWLSMGAQPTATIYNILADAKIVTGKKHKATRGKKKKPEEKKIESGK